MKQVRFLSPITFLSLTLVFIFVFYHVNAQSNTDYSSPSLPSLIPGLEEQIDVNIDPQNPAPNQLVRATLQAFGTDLNRANISWLLNGRVMKNGVGAIEFDFNAGKGGTVNNLSAIILPVNGTKIEKDLKITAASVDITWESSSYVPPFYKGKKLYPPQGSLTFVALPNLVQNGTTIDSKSLDYKWTLNGSILGDKSGYGKNTLVVNGDILNQTIDVEVEASSVNNEVVGDGSVSVSSEDPEVLFYENNPLYGVLFNNSLNNQYNLQNSELDLSAYPYYFSAASPSDPTLNYGWSINNSSIPLPAQTNSVVFRRPDSSEGASSISVNLTNPKNILQSAANNLMINFSGKTNTNVTF